MVVIVIGFSASTASAQSTVSLLKDWPHLPGGVEVLHRDQQIRSVLGRLFPFSASGTASAWTLAQWHGEYPILPPGSPTITGGGVEYKTPGKRVVFGPGNRLVLGINGIDRALHTNTGDKEKTQFSLAQETWIPGASYYRLTDLESLRMSLKIRLNKAAVGTGGLETGSKSTQVFISMHIRNVATEGPAADDLLYFVVGLYDDRYPDGKPEVVTVDGASLNQFIIYNTGSAAVLGNNKSLNDRQWHTVDVDLLPLMKKGLTKAWNKADEPDVNIDFSSKRFVDYTLSHFGLAWEMSQNRNAEVEIQDLKLDAKVIPTKPLLSISAAKSSVLKGDSTVISWSATNVPSCTVAGPGITSSKLSGSASTGPLEESAKYTLTCGDESRTVTVRALALGCTITASPSHVKRGELTTLSWTARGNYLSATLDPSLGSVGSATSKVVRPARTTNYVLSLWAGTSTTAGGERARYQQCDVTVVVEGEPKDTTPPNVSLSSVSSPLSGITTVSAVATDDVGVKSVQFKKDGTILGTDASAPYSFTWDTRSVSNGKYRISATARDAAGNEAVDEHVVTVLNMSAAAKKIQGDLHQTEAALRAWQNARSEWRLNSSFATWTDSGNPTIIFLVQEYPELRAHLAEAPRPPEGVGAYRYKNNGVRFECGGNIQAGVNIIVTRVPESVKKDLDIAIDGGDGGSCGKITYDAEFLLYKLSNSPTLSFDSGAYEVPLISVMDAETPEERSNVAAVLALVQSWSNAIVTVLGRIVKI